MSNNKNIFCSCAKDKENCPILVKEKGEICYGCQFSCKRYNLIQIGRKDDGDKPPMELLSNQALIEIAKVFGHGAKKYGKYNYKSGIHYSRIIGAAYRHLGAFNSGEDLDKESGISHIAHLGCCVVMLLDYIADHPELDDRFKPTKSK